MSPGSLESTQEKQAIVVGAGYTGLAAAYDLAQAGFTTTVYEADREIGGLAGAFELSPGYSVEKFYHHWFNSDRDIIDWLSELGLEDRIRPRATETGIYYANSVFRLASPLDLLKFTPLPIIDRIRTGLMAVAARLNRNWRSLEDVSALDWIGRVAGRRSLEVIWRPLLEGKFGAEAENVSAVWLWNKLVLRGASRDSKGHEELLYFDGGFHGATREIEKALRGAGVEIKTGVPVERVIVDSNRVLGVEVEGKKHLASSVVVTTPLPTFLDMVPELPKSFRESARQIRFLGNVCLVLRLKKSLSSTYWLNVADPNFPFVGIIEHTNFDDPSNYGGEHVAYLSRYAPTSDKLFQMSEEEIFQYCLPYLQKMFPDFDSDWVIGYRVWKAQYSQPVITKGYSSIIPPMETPIDGLWLSTMAQIYPEDRGTNYAVRGGRAVARKVIESNGSS